MRTAPEKTDRRAANVNQRVVTTGQIFSDGAIFELISSSCNTTRPDLLLWSNGKATTGCRIEYAGYHYEAPILDAVLYHAVQLPAGCTEYGTDRQLLIEISDVCSEYSSLARGYSQIVARVAAASWLSDRVPSAPVLLLFGPNESVAINLLRLMHCLCRHGLLLAEMSPGSLKQLPMQLALTLLINQYQLQPALQRLLRASSYRGMYLPGRNGIISAYGVKAVYCARDATAEFLASNAIHIALPPMYMHANPLAEDTLRQIAGHLQPR